VPTGIGAAAAAHRDTGRVSLFARLRAWLAALRQPWRFALYASSAWLVLLLVTRGDAPRAAAGALLWALLMSLWDTLRRRRQEGE